MAGGTFIFALFFRAGTIAKNLFVALNNQQLVIQLITFS